jgi:hypothetical protein
MKVSSHYIHFKASPAGGRSHCLPLRPSVWFHRCGPRTGKWWMDMDGHLKQPQNHRQIDEIIRFNWPKCLVHQTECWPPKAGVEPTKIQSNNIWGFKKPEWGIRTNLRSSPWKLGISLASLLTNQYSPQIAWLLIGYGSRFHTLSTKPGC